ncbi:short-chain dehydrogenase [Luteitalea sp. TBR-22]|uniref:SDR family oxidoreductase n=1 Tax=Luteitalea sp. TBR-22 TaxID=2802971 RepID=UPI001AF828AC|nr:SDR family oxidoreductase [Luteitalea sp. TBR-22]BCS35551.1 short-chain dehydrogenase [Luteitalea sp. TBR-22]
MARYGDRVVIVTGGSRGIGEGVVRAFVEAGSRVTIADIDAPTGEALARSLGGAATFARLDVRSDEEVGALIADVVAREGRLDCLVNNAGTHPPHLAIDDITPAAFRELLALNLVSQFVACRAALPHLRATRGCIINMGSLVGSLGQAHAVDYVTTKGAIAAMTRALAIDEARHGVRVNCVSPGNIDTPLWQSFAERAADPEAVRRDGAQAQWIGRLGTIDEVGRLCVFLAAEATYTTGVDHVISGGAELGYGRKETAPTSVSAPRTAAVAPSPPPGRRPPPSSSSPDRDTSR